jgi:DnaA family protein
LLYAACHYLASNDSTVAFVPLNQYKKLSIELFEGLENLDLVCIDDVDAISNVSEWEQALFHLYNRARTSKTRLILSSHSVPRSCGLQLKDLVSRLSWGLVLQVNELDDPDKILAMQIRAKQRGIDLPVQVGEYLLRRQPRNIKSLFDLLDSLDRASLAAQRKLTIPFVKEFLETSKVSV